MSCVPRDKGRLPSRGRGAFAEGGRTSLCLFLWAAGEDPPDCHDFLVERCHFPLGTVCLRALYEKRPFFVDPARSALD